MLLPVLFPAPVQDTTLKSIVKQNNIDNILFITLSLLTIGAYTVYYIIDRKAFGQTVFKRVTVFVAQVIESAASCTFKMQMLTLANGNLITGMSVLSRRDDPAFPFKLM